MKFSQTTFVLHVTVIIKNKLQREQALYFGERSEPRRNVASPRACTFHNNPLWRACSQATGGSEKTVSLSS